MDREAWRATVHGVARIRYDLVTKPLNTTTKDFILTKKKSYFQMQLHSELLGHRTLA